MSKLYDISYNKRQWHITGSRETKYLLINISTRKSYVACGDIIGIYQISDDEFLIHRRIERYIWQILRVKYSDSDSKITFKKSFENFCFLTDDTILFDNFFVYSISRNKEVEEFRWLKFKDIKLEKVGDETVLLLNARCSTSDDKVVVLVDIETFNPVSQAYSSLRDMLFDVKTKEDVIRIIAEDEHYLDVINWTYYYQNREKIYKNTNNLFLNYLDFKKK